MKTCVVERLQEMLLATTLPTRSITSVYCLVLMSVVGGRLSLAEVANEA